MTTPTSLSQITRSQWQPGNHKKRGAAGETSSRKFQQVQLLPHGNNFLNRRRSERLNTKVIRKRLTKIGRNKSVGPDGFPGEILKLVVEAMTPYLARLLKISLNNATIPSDSKITTVVPIYKREYRSAL